MPEISKKEPGRPDVVERERGDPRQHHQPIDKQRDTTATSPGAGKDGPPSSSPRGYESPWMGGG